MNDDLKTKRIINNLDAFLDRIANVCICNKVPTLGERYMCYMAVAEKADAILANLGDTQDQKIRTRAKEVSERAHGRVNWSKPKKTEDLYMPETLKERLEDAIQSDAYMVRQSQLTTANTLLEALEDPILFEDLGYPQHASKILTSEEIYASALAIAAFADYHVNNFRRKKDFGSIYTLWTVDLLDKANNIADRHKPISKSDLRVPDFIQEILRKEDIDGREQN